MINLTREEAQMVLHVLKYINKLSVGVNAICLPAEIDEVMGTLRAKLSEPEQTIKAYKVGGLIVADLPKVPAGGGGIRPEPTIDGWPLYSGLPPVMPGGGGGSGQIYKVQKQSKWVGLTAQDLADVGPENYIGAIWADGRLREKNEN
jgi:hypothetical protein